MIGGGAVAARKAAGLVAAGARPVVISPTLHAELENMRAAGQIEHFPRPYQPGDLEGAFLVIAATEDPGLNRQVGEACRRAGVLVNVVDSPQECNFIAPAVVRRGDFVVSISTGGTAPALAARTRATLEARFGREYEAMTALCAAIRPAMRTAFPDPAERKARWYALINSPVFFLLVSGRVSDARAWAEAMLGTRLDEVHSLEARTDSHGQR
ncbi:MAG: bifunctional precorrin-2 dehydrogenase/sirohydrochlorin ferrochelatase [Chloroflexi bacterium]|nr:bifunctional precorrin-2 dehydrogenase/sirohydrochlorin ferrochelatase [Chloroflexota bacterium]